jgi:hypothetical protein
MQHWHGHLWYPHRKDIYVSWYKCILLASCTLKVSIYKVCRSLLNFSQKVAKAILGERNRWQGAMSQSFGIRGFRVLTRKAGDEARTHDINLGKVALYH